jgi:hypothetical protein
VETRRENLFGFAQAQRFALTIDVRRRVAKLHLSGLGEEADFGDSRANRSCDDPQAHAARRYALSPHQALVADTGPTCKFHPFPIAPRVEREFIDTLPEGQVLAQPHDVECRGRGQIENEFRPELDVIGGPVRIAIPVDRVAGGVSRFVPPGIA